MAHQAQYDFFKRVRNKYPEKFSGVRVLDVGSYDVNSTKRGVNTRDLFKDSEYLGIDQREGPGVDVVVKAHEFSPDYKFDVVISGSTFEHDKYYEQTLPAIAKLLESGGLFLFTCGSGERQEHGTHRMPDQGEIYADDGEFYKNFMKEDFEKIPGFLEFFTDIHFEYQADGLDIFFSGIRK